MGDELCYQCGHPAGPHLLCGYEDDHLGVPIGGWRECPVKFCMCYATWSISEELLEQLEKLRLHVVMDEN